MSRYCVSMFRYCVSVCRYSALVLILFAPLGFAQEGASVQGRDPTRPLGYQSVTSKGSAAKEGALRLSSVLISTQRKLAIINGQSLREGQSIPGSNGVSLVSIHAYGVVVQQGGRKWELRLAPQVIKKN